MKGSNNNIKLKKVTNTSRKSIIMKGKSGYYSYAAVLGILCIACLPLFVTAQRRNEGLPLRRRDVRAPDLMAAESQNVGVAQQRAPMKAQASAPVPTAAMPPSNVAPPPSPPLSVASSSSSISSYASPDFFPSSRSDLTGSPSYSPRYSIPSSNPWKEPFPFEVATFRRRATADDDGAATYPEDDYKPSESKGKKHKPSMFKRMSSSIRNTGKAIFGAPSYIYRRYSGSWKKMWSPSGSGGGGKKKKGYGKSHSSGYDKNKNDDGWGGWEEVEPSGNYDYEPSHWGSKGWSSKGSSYDSHERRYDRDSTGYRDYRDREYRDKDYRTGGMDRDRDYRDDYKDYDSSYRSPPASSHSRSRDSRDSRRQNKYGSPDSYREETHYDDYDGRRTTAYYGANNRRSPPSSSSSSSSTSSTSSSSKRPYSGSSSSNSGKSGSNRYNDEY